MKSIKFFLLLAFVFAFVSCDDDEDIAMTQPGTFEVTFENQFNETNLQLNTTYTTSEGETISFTRYEYILSNFRLIADNGTEYAVPDSYYFMGQGVVNPTMRRAITFTGIPAGNYTAIKFAVGVDAATNTSTDQYEKGELQGGVGMDWGWNSGYKFINWEGTYFNIAENVSKDFKLHIGSDANYKEMTISFGQNLAVNGASSGQVYFEVMAEKVFNGLSFNELGLNLGGGAFSGVMAGPADKAAQIASQWQSMFILHHAESMSN